jgi:hypothetical protein
VFINPEISFAVAVTVAAKPSIAPVARSQPTLRIEWAAGVALTLWMVCLHVVYLVHAGPLWRDECGTIAYASMPFAEMWHNLQYDNLPPLFEWIARLWTLAGFTTDFGYRVLGFIVGIATLTVIWLSARSTGATFPLLTLAFYALNPTALRVGDSMRPYGLGFLANLATFALAWKFAQTQQRKWFIAASIAAVLSVQLLYQSAFYIAAFVLAAAFVCICNKQRKRAAMCVAIGAIAAVSLLPHVPNIHKGELWRDIARVPVNAQLVQQALSELLTVGHPFMQPIYILLFVGTLAFGVTAAIRWKKSHVIYATIVFVLITLSQIGILTQLKLPPRSWYFLIWLAPMAICADVIWSTFNQRNAQITRVAIICSIALLCAPQCWSQAKLRQTNVDLIAAKLKTDRKPGDLVLAAPWFNGVSLCRYYPTNQFTTLPPMEEIRIHRYDLMKRAMSSTDPIGPLQTQIEQTLRNGNTLWVVGSLKFPQPGESVPTYPPYFKGIGNNDAAYYFSWSTQLGKMVKDHAITGEVVEVKTPYEISKIENFTLIAIRGWHD